MVGVKIGVWLGMRVDIFLTLRTCECSYKCQAACKTKAAANKAGSGRHRVTEFQILKLIICCALKCRQSQREGVG